VKDTKHQKSLEYFHEGYGIPKRRIQNTQKVLNISMKNTEYQKSITGFNPRIEPKAKLRPICPKRCQP